MSNATVNMFIDRYHPQKDGKCKISVRVTHLRKHRYYATSLTLKVSEFDRIMNAKRRNDSDTKIYYKILAFEKKAIDSVEQLPVFTFDLFENIYLNNRGAVDSIKYAFEKYINELKQENRIGTAVTYECAIKSIEAFKSGLKLADITPTLLKKYENTMIDAGNSKTTVGIYLRSLRTIFNRAQIDPALYPFGNKKGKYAIPIGRNIKKALKLDEIGRIFQYEAPAGSFREMAKDYWIFLYLCNGMNVKDMCMLKWKNIKGDMLTYERAKTIRSKKESKEIEVSLKATSKEIIRKWGRRSLDKEAFIFPHLQKGLPAKREYEIIQQLTYIINKHMKQIAKELDIQKEVTTYFARHSFATIMRNSDASISLISNLLGHGDMKTTENYLAGFEQETIHKTTDALLAFAK